jgi:4-amino-4-deoxy-L-arabinose transferase-like glycosyltransferase
MIAAICIAFFTFAAAAVVSRTVFERLPHLEDEFGYLFEAKTFAGGHAWVPRNEPVAYLWQPFVVQPENSVDGIQKRFGKYTPGWPLLLTTGVVLGQTWVVNAFLAMLSVSLVYRLGREIFDEPVGIVSALLLAISPMAIMLNATLMSHTSAMFMAVAFVYCYWRVTKHGKRRYLWAIACGLALGWMAATRPLSALAIAVPVVLHAASRLLDTLFDAKWREKAVPTLLPLLVIIPFTLLTLSTWGIYNYLTTGDWKTDTYTLLWDYDTPGFGPGHGLMTVNGVSHVHTLEFGFRNMRQDMGVYLRDLFGFTMDPGVEKYLEDNVGWGAGIGLSWLLVLAGLIAGRKHEWIWLFAEIFIAVVIAQMTYWIGSVVYGTAAYSLRYWYEATFAVCLVGGYGAVAWIRAIRGKPERQRKGQATTSSAGTNNPIVIDYLEGLDDTGITPNVAKARTFGSRLGVAWETLWPGYILLEIAVLASLLGYTPARFQEPAAGWPNGLFRYNKVGQDQVEEINSMRQPGQKVLLLILHDPSPGVPDDWRNYGAAMALTSPYLDSDIIVVRVFEKENVDEVVKRFSGRLVLYQVGDHLYRTLEQALGDDKTSFSLTGPVQ